MAHQRFDLAGGGASAKQGRPSKAAAGDDRKKNIILLSIAGVAFAVAGYFIFTTFFGAPAAPAETTPAMEEAFEKAVQPPPPADSQPMTGEPGSGKRAY